MWAASKLVALGIVRRKTFLSWDHHNFQNYVILLTVKGVLLVTKNKSKHGWKGGSGCFCLFSSVKKSKDKLGSQTTNIGTFPKFSQFFYFEAPIISVLLKNALFNQWYIQLVVTILRFFFLVLWRFVVKLMCNGV